MGVSVKIVDSRVIVSIHCRMEPVLDYHDDYYESYEEDEDFEEETPPEPTEMDSLPRPVKDLLALLD